jgi:hypothetical protein
VDDSGAKQLRGKSEKDRGEKQSFNKRMHEQLKVVKFIATVMRLCKLQLSHVYAVPREITIKFTLGTTWVVMVRPGIRAQGGIPNGRGLMTLLVFFEAESCRFEFHDGINVPYFNCFLILTTLAANYCNESTKTFTTESNLTSTIAQLLLRDLAKYATTMKIHKNLSRCNYCDYISNTEMQV